MIRTTRVRSCLTVLMVTLTFFALVQVSLATGDERTSETKSLGAGKCTKAIQAKETSSQPSYLKVELDPLSEHSHLFDIFMVGEKLTEDVVEKYEEHLKVSPNDIEPRVALLGYYHFKSSGFNRHRPEKQASLRHQLWIIKNIPGSVAANHPFVRTSRFERGHEAYLTVKKLWLEHIKKQSKDLRILANAAHFFTLYDRALSEKLLKEGKILDPGNPDWPKRLVLVYELYAIGNEAKKTEWMQKALAEAEEAFELAEGVEKPRILEDIARISLEVGDLDKAKTYSTRLIDTANEQYPWNKASAIHYGNVFLGRVALKNGDIDKAKEHLLKAGNAPGFIPDLGPDLLLAKELLAKGETEAVLQYLTLCETFWEGKRPKLKLWKSMIKEGRVPDFKHY